VRTIVKKRARDGLTDLNLGHDSISIINSGEARRDVANQLLLNPNVSETQRLSKVVFILGHAKIFSLK
jgi:uncharacterized Ntn-hydrolase superfamily protein